MVPNQLNAEFLYHCHVANILKLPFITTNYFFFNHYLKKILMNKEEHMVYVSMFSHSATSLSTNTFHNGQEGSWDINISGYNEW